MTDYTQLIDAETWAFIRETESWYPADAVDESIDQQRNRYDAMCRAFLNGYPDGVSATVISANGVPVRHYRKNPATEAPLVIYMHGGGYVVGGLESHDDVCAEICDATGYDVLSVDYRLAPEHVHPASYDDCLAAFLWAEKCMARPVILCGDSAGGSLAASVAHTSRGRGTILGQVLIYPGLGADRAKGSFVTHANAPLLTLKDTLFYEKIRSNGAPPKGDPTFAPLADTDFSNLPPTVVITAECDPLASNGPDYCKAISDAGGTAVWIEEPGLVHGYLRARHTVGRARASFHRITRAIKMIGSGEQLSTAALAD